MLAELEQATLTEEEPDDEQQNRGAIQTPRGSSSGHSEDRPTGRKPEPEDAPQEHDVSSSASAEQWLEGANA